ncbi:MAG: 3-isopropylmalate dehydratase large subunit [Silanimonas sp.]
MSAARTLFDKLWDAHLVRSETERAPAILYIDLHLLHEVTSPQAFAELAARDLKIRRPERHVATLDHSTPTAAPDAQGQRAWITPQAEAQVEALRSNCTAQGVELFDWDSGKRGIVHVVGPERGLTQPGMTIVCGDSHTATHGAFGALAFGIGSSEVGHVMATQCLLQRKAKSMAITVEGRLPAGCSAKDLILHIIGRIGVAGGTGHVIEYRGPAIEALSMEERMTVCNMSIEAGARAGLIGVDDITIDWLRGRERVPQGAAFDIAATTWRRWRSDDGARFDREVRIDASEVKPTLSWGTHPGQVVAVDAALPAAAPETVGALSYMGFEGGTALAGQPVDVVFVGSCTNGRLSDLREAAAVLRGRRVHPRVRMLVVPGSDAVKRDAEAEGLGEVFRAAGAEWREPGCSMCIAMNGDAVKPGQLAVSTSNRNFEGRQGKGARTLLASPASAAAAAVAGAVADPRAYLDAAPSSSRTLTAEVSA